MQITTCFIEAKKILSSFAFSCGTKLPSAFRAATSLRAVSKFRRLLLACPPDLRILFLTRPRIAMAAWEMF